MTTKPSNLHHGKWHLIVDELLAAIPNSERDDVGNDRRVVVKLDETASLVFEEYDGKMFWLILAVTGELIDSNELYDVEHALAILEQTLAH